MLRGRGGAGEFTRAANDFFWSAWIESRTNRSLSARHQKKGAIQRCLEPEAQEAEGLCDLMPRQQKRQTGGTTQRSLCHFSCGY